MASDQGFLASTGAFANDIVNVATSFLQNLTEYLHTTTGIPISPATLSGAFAVIILLGALPTVAARAKSGDKMDRRPRFGWSGGYGGRGPISPFASNLGHDGQPPDIMDEDFSYITSQDLENHNIDRSRYYDPRSSNQRMGRSEPSLEIPDDDIVLIKHRGITYPEHFPAYSIGDGKLIAGDVRDRAQLVMKLSNRQTNNLRMYYKGKQLKDDEEPVCNYGVKNKSEIMIVLPEDEDVGGGRSSSETSEEIVVVQGEDTDSRSGKKKSRRSRKKHRDPSPRESSSNVGLSAPEPDQRRQRAPSVSRMRSPERPATGTTIAVPRPPLIPAAPNSAMDKLNKIQESFDETLRPMCEQFVSNPPDDPKKCVEEYRKISETVLQKVLLKLDEIDTGGDDSIRMRRKELVKYVQEVLKPVDKYSPDAK